MNNEEMKRKKRDEWEIAAGLISIDGLKFSDDVKELIEKEINGEITKDDVRKYIYIKYNIKRDALSIKDSKE